MAVDITMPKLSDTMEEGRIIKWLKQPGDAVKPGDVLAEVETDKANMELEAYDEGVLQDLRVAEGESAAIGAVIATLAGPGEAAGAVKTSGQAEPAARPAAPAPAKEPPARREPAPAEPSPQASRAAGGAMPREERRPPRPAAAAHPSDADAVEIQVKASPLARRIAREHGVDLQRVRGSGPGGRIVEDDVRAALERGPARPAAARQPAEAPRPRPAAAPATGERVELSRMRRTTARRMAEAKRDVPHFYASADIRMDEAVRVKAQLAALGGEFEGLTYTHLLLRAVGLALRRVPELNASWDGDTVVRRESVHVGIATATDDGLVVPVVRDCDRSSLAQIVQQARAVVERARAGRFGADDLTGATFSVSNLGMFPVTDFAAIINPPHAGILAVGTVREAPVVEQGRVVAGHVMTVTLSCDHRVVDGVVAGRFLRELKALLEAPLALVV
jgi:pyruvate dehydrogenase E2 component (dihydrolipoamide acetyltransferase)